MSDLRDAFSDPQLIARYAEMPPRKVPGFADLHRMSTLLLEEHAPDDARILVVGAGGGLELKAFALAHPRWTFDGVDPSPEMLALATRTLGPLTSQVQLYQGTIHEAPAGPYHGATCLLTLHFLSIEERRQTLAQVHHRLQPGAPFVVAHMSFPQDTNARQQWIARYVAFAASNDPEPEKVKNSGAAIDQRLTILSPEQEESLLRDAGFSGVSLFYAGFAFRGWVGWA